VHDAEEFDASVLLYRPPSHGVHAEDATSMLYLPLMQALQSLALSEPVTSRYFPAVH
jgi:hypothetical protein